MIKRLQSRGSLDTTDAFIVSNWVLFLKRARRRSAATSPNILELGRRNCVTRDFRSGTHYASCCDVPIHVPCAAGALAAGDVLVLLDASSPCLSPLFRQFVGNCRTASEVHLVRRLTIKSALRHPLVVFVDVEFDQPSQRDNVVESVDKQPAEFQDPPEALNTLPIQLFLNLASEL